MRKDYNGGMVQFGSVVRRLILPGVVIASLGAATMLHGQDAPKRGRKYKVPPATSHVVITVLRGTTGKPLVNASVIFHPLEDGHDDGNMELKTDDDGKATLDLLETGSSVRIQILADGWQTFGQDFKVDKSDMAIEVKLNRPVGQYSIYKKDGGLRKDGDGKVTEDGKPATPKPDGASDAQPKDQSGSSTDAKAQDSKDESAKSDAPKDDAKPQDSSSQPK
ncbi:carboxypeptidase-like regulatory domain-containing protein [Acidicapsa dinghuensis]|uniref:Carboxypeptidase-like regulatory domain-containing protein n=1 Tax=Acidicapsa dinghuensis TaxID=2218256 RepID=A0ABW1EKL1_9BACT|nr:carboxypeptidase-like regulatory domain-containing protein [Acidicapsa dinghuensis]